MVFKPGCYTDSLRNSIFSNSRSGFFYKSRRFKSLGESLINIERCLLCFVSLQERLVLVVSCTDKGLADIQLRSSKEKKGQAGEIAVELQKPRIISRHL